MLHFEWMVVA